MFNKISFALLALMSCFTVPAFAGLEAATLTDITAGIGNADANYYAIGGSILVVLAGIWGFRLVVRLVK